MHFLLIKLQPPRMDTPAGAWPMLSTQRSGPEHKSLMTGITQRDLLSSAPPLKIGWSVDQPLAKRVTLYFCGFG